MQHDLDFAAATRASRRHYGLDWLRIAAFALLIFYHVGMVFSPYRWVIHTPRSYDVLIAPMALLNPWRLSLLFAVSGYASRALFEKSGGAVAFARSRATRLLVPLAFGMAAIVPIEMWVIVREAGYLDGYLHFWAFDYARWGTYFGHEFPSWEHLWFLAYLAAYTFVLAGALRLWDTKLVALGDAAAAWLGIANRLLWVPAVLLVCAKLSLLFVVPEKIGLVRDWAGHALYLPIFLFGFVLGGAPALWPVVARLWKPAGGLAAVAGAIVVAMEFAYPGATPIGHAAMALERAARVTMAWSMVLVLLHLANRFWNRDHPWRAPLAEAVFPFYLIHHPVIVLIAWVTLPLRLNPFAEFALLVGGTLAACIAFYGIGREISWLRPLIGLTPRGSTPRVVPVERPA